MKKSIVARFGALMVIFATFAGCTSEDPSPSPADPRESFVGNWMVNETGMKSASPLRCAFLPGPIDYGPIRWRAVP